MDINVNDHRPPRRRTHLFTVRLWFEPGEADQIEIRGKAQHVLTGEVHYFRDWAALADFCTAEVARAEADAQG